MSGSGYNMPSQATVSEVEMPRQPMQASGGGGPRFPSGFLQQLHQTDAPSIPEDASGVWDAATATSFGAGESWLENWFGPSRNFSEPIDYQFWEDLVGSLEARQ